MEESKVAEVNCERSAAASARPATRQQASYAVGYEMSKAPQTRHVHLRLRLRGDLSIPDLEAAMRQFIRSHPALRTTLIVAADGSVSQILSDPRPINLGADYIPWAGKLIRKRYTRRYLKRAFKKKISLSSAPLMNIALLNVAENEYLLLLVFHHAICDGWSIGIAARDLISLYRCSEQRQQFAQLEEPAGFESVVVPTGARHENQSTEYWRNRLKGVVAPYWIPSDPPRRFARRSTIHVGAVLLQRNESAKLAELARRARLSTWMFVLATVATAVHEWSGQDDVVISVVHPGRHRLEQHRMIGCLFENWLLRVGIEKKVDIVTLAARIRDAYLEALPHMHVPYPQIAACLPPITTDVRGAPIVFNYVPDYGANSIQLQTRDCVRSGGAIERLKIDMDEGRWRPYRLRDADGGDHTKLRMIFQDVQGLIGWDVAYSDRLFHRRKVDQFMRRVTTALADIASDQAAPAPSGQAPSRLTRAAL